MEVEQLKKERAKLEREIEELENNPRAVEKTAREKLWLMEPDEFVIIKKDKEEKKNKNLKDKNPDK